MESNLASLSMDKENRWNLVNAYWSYGSHMNDFRSVVPRRKHLGGASVGCETRRGNSRRQKVRWISLDLISLYSNGNKSRSSIRYVSPSFQASSHSCDKWKVVQLSGLILLCRLQQKWLQCGWLLKIVECWCINTLCYIYFAWGWLRLIFIFMFTWYILRFSERIFSDIIFLYIL